MQQELFSRSVVKFLSALDLNARDVNMTAARFHRLLTDHLAPMKLLTCEEKADYQHEVGRLQVDDHLPEFESGTRLDTWRTVVFRTGNSPCLAGTVTTCLSIFVPPQVDGSFIRGLDEQTIGWKLNHSLHCKTSDTI